jgi:hypothetical protein
MEFHLVDAMACAVVIVQRACRLASRARSSVSALPSSAPSACSEAAAARAFALQGFLQGRIGGKQVDIANGATVLRTSWVSKGCILSPFKLLFFILLNNTL